MSTHAQFTSITPGSIIDARPGGASPHQFRVNWVYPNDNYAITRVGIYRYITGRTTGETTFDLSNPNYLIASYTTDAASITSFTDNLQQYYNTNSQYLKNLYGDTLTSADSQLLDEVYYSRRGIIYGISISKSAVLGTTINTSISAGGFDTQPYVVITHSNTGKVQCISTKTQVKHNVLHLEGDDIWLTQLASNAAKPGTPGNVVLDLDRIYLNGTTHGGPSGIGGWAWVQTLPLTNPVNNGYLYRCALRNGVLDSVFTMVGSNAGQLEAGGLTVDAKSGNAFAIPYTEPVDGGGQYQVAPGGASGTSNSVAIGGNILANKFDTRGACTAPATPNTYWAVANTNNGYNYRITKILNTGTGVWTSTPYIHSDGSSTAVGASEIASGPDGTIFASTKAGNNDGIYYIPDTTLYTSVSYLFLNRSNESNRTICADDDLLYPNNQPLSGINGYSVWVANPEINITSRAFFSKTTKTLQHQYSDLNRTYLNLPLSATGMGTEPYRSYDAIGIGADSENNIWIIGNDGSGYSVSKLYRMINNNTYPYGGYSRYPAVALSAWASTLTNTKEIEWFLTRDPSLMTPSISATWYSYTSAANSVLVGTNGAQTQLSGLVVTGATLSQQIANVYAFINTAGVNQNALSGRLIYPHYTGFDKIYQWTDTTGYKGNVTYCRTGITGKLKTGYYISNTISNFESFSDYIHPVTTAPTVKFLITDPQQNSSLYEPNNWPWGTSVSGTMLGAGLLPYPPGIVPAGAGPFQSVTGYDDQTVDFWLSTNPGSFILTAVALVTEDINRSVYQIYSSPNALKIYNINQNYDPAGAYVTDYKFNYTFSNPSLVGSQSQGYQNNPQRVLSPGYLRSYFINGGGAATYADPYTLNNMQTFITPLTPYPAFPMITVDFNLPIPAIIDIGYVTVTERWPTPSFSIQPTQTQTNWYGYEGNDQYVNGGIAYAQSPVTAALWDSSIARTYPVAVWNMTISASTSSTPQVLDWTPVVSTLWKYTTSISFTATNATRLPADTINSISRGTSSVFPFMSAVYNYGLYGFTLGVVASASNTKGALYDGVPTTFTQYLCVNAIPPTSNWGVLSACTVPGNYSNTHNIPSSSLLISDSIAGSFISGYAPNLTVYFADSSTPGTNAVQSFIWNFGDYYDQYNNTAIYAVSGSAPSHTYTIPGTYNVTYCVQPNTTFSASCCARSATPSTSFYILVKEIDPNASFTISASASAGFFNSLTGMSPFTVYANPCSIHLGSFDIGRIDYDFGDNSNIETVTRYPLLSTTNNGTITYNSGLSIYDLNDPRNYIVPHQYVSNIQQTYNISMTAYANNTNTASVCAIGSAVTIQNNIVSVSSARRHLMKSRFLNSNDDVVYVLEDGSTNTSFAVVLSGD